MQISLLVVAPFALLVAQLAAQGPRSAIFTGNKSVRDAASVKPEQGEPDGPTASWGTDFATAYFFRGMRFEDRGAIVQPHLELVYGLHAAESGVRSVDLVLGTWNSLHGGPTGTRGGSSAWYESDFYAGIAVGLSDQWSASGTYSFYASPNGAFSVSEEAIFSIAYDDAPHWGEDFGGLQPTVVVGVEVKGQQDGGMGRGVYAQVAFEPGLALGKSDLFDWSLALPCAIGASLGDYYEDSTGTDHAFGFCDVGAVLCTPLPFVPSRFGPWTMSVAVHALLLGKTAEEANRGDAFALIGSLGFSTTF